MERQRSVLEQFERDGLDPAAFDHAAHVFVAWSLVRRDGPERGGRRFARRLRSWTRRWGVEGKYHATVTGAWLRLIAARARASGDSWDAFRSANTELFGSARSLLARYYSAARLDSARARRRFLPPDLRPLTGSVSTRGSRRRSATDPGALAASGSEEA